MSVARNWNTVTESKYPWEKDALDFVRQGFPTHEPYRAWSNFEFIADDGSINEVDLLVFTPQGFFLIEIKSRLGRLFGDAGISRLRRDAQLFDLPTPSKGRRGRPRIYGNRLSLAKRAGQSRGWQTITFLCRGVQITRRCKTFLATTRLTGGVVRVVLLQPAPGNWAAYFSTDQTLDAKTILEIGAERWAIEETFHDVKEVWGAGQQQVRNVWSSIGCWHLNTWLYSLVELACWDRPVEDLVDRSDRSWDNPNRRPSHADRRRRIRREMLEKQFLTHLPPDLKKAKFLDRLHQLLALAA